MMPFSLNDDSWPHPKNQDGELIKIVVRKGFLNATWSKEEDKGGFEYTWMRCIAMINLVSFWSVTCGSSNDVDPTQGARRPSSPQTGSVHYCRL